MPTAHARFLECVERRIPVALLTHLNGRGGARHLAVDARAGATGSLGDAALDREVMRLGEEALRTGRSARHRLERARETVDLFVDVQWPRDHLIVVGAVHIAIPLVSMARILGFYTIVIDSRTAFATAERFSHADELRPEWPEDALRDMVLGPSSYLVFLSHDEKLDYPALELALRRELPYVGALGSRKTHAKRCRALRAAGLDDAALARIHAPIGLDIAARTPEEIALAVLAEIVKVKNAQEN